MKLSRFLPARCLLVLSFSSLTCCFTVSASSHSTQESGPVKLSYPDTPKGEVVDTYFGVPVADPYRWLENDNAEDVKEWVKEQADFANEYFSIQSLSQLRENLKTRLNEILDYTTPGVPSRHGQHLYFWKKEGLKPHSIFYRKAISPFNAPEEVVLDPNTFSSDGTIAASPVGFDQRHRYMVYQVNKAGSDWQTFRVRDLTTLKDLDDKLEWIKFSGAAFAGDGFFYQRYPQPKPDDVLSGVNKDAAVYFHKLGDTQDKDRLIFSNPQAPENNFSVETSEDQSYLFISEQTGTYGNALHFLDLTAPQATIKTLVDDFSSENSFVTVIDHKAFVRTDRDAANFRVVSFPLRAGTGSPWQTVIAEDAANKLDSISYLGGVFLGRYIVDVTSRVKRFDKQGKLLGEVKLPGLGTVGGFGGEESHTETFYSFVSYTVPDTIYHYDIINDRSTLYFSAKDSIKINTNDYVSEQVFFPSKDGTKIPMFLMYRQGMKRNGKNPTMLYGYGGFNISLEPSFSTIRFAFLEQGGVIAIANLRGGGEYGEKWHQAGMKLNKQNVFDDFIAAGEYLIREGFTSSAKLAINGGSNGGLLVGAVLTQRPDLMRVAIPEVGVLDMLRFHKFTIGHAWAVEYGSSEESEEMFKYLLGYSPLHNVKDKTCYPATMIMTSDHDDRVVPAHSFKFAARLQEAQGCKDPILLRVTTKAGHGGSNSLQQVIEKAADRYAFILYHTR